MHVNNCKMTTQQSSREFYQPRFYRKKIESLFVHTSTIKIIFIYRFSHPHVKQSRISSNDWIRSWQNKERGKVILIISATNTQTKVSPGEGVGPRRHLPPGDQPQLCSDDAQVRWAGPRRRVQGDQSQQRTRSRDHNARL